MAAEIHPAAIHHLPGFITAPGQSDVLMNVTIVMMLVIVLGVGNLYLRLHSLPEKLAHGAGRMQFEIVAILALLALFTHNNIFWIAALLLALIRLPDYMTPLIRIADSVETIAASSTPEDRADAAEKEEVPEKESQEAPKADDEAGDGAPGREEKD